MSTVINRESAPILTEFAKALEERKGPVYTLRLCHFTNVNVTCPIQGEFYCFFCHGEWYLVVSMLRFPYLDREYVTLPTTNHYTSTSLCSS